MNTIVINTRSITRTLVLIASILILLSFGTQLLAYKTGHHYMRGLIPFLNVDAELNLPTFFSGLILLIASSLQAIIYILNRKRKV